MNKRPLSVTIMGWLFIAAGTVGLVYHSRDLRHLFQNDSVWVCLVRVLAIVAGVYVLRRRNWARWLCVVWMAYHVGLSAYHSMREVIMHAVLLVLIAYCLFQRKASAYFCPIAPQVQKAPETP